MAIHSRYIRRLPTKGACFFLFHLVKRILKTPTLNSLNDFRLIHPYQSSTPAGLCGPGVIMAPNLLFPWSWLFKLEIRAVGLVK